MSEVSQAPQAQSAAVEPQQTAAAPESAPQPRSEDGKFASKFAALTRKDKELRDRERLFASKLSEYEEKDKKYSAWEQEKARIEAEKDSWKKKNPFELLKDAGYTFEQLVEMQLNEQNPTPDMKLSRMQQELEEKTNSRIAELEAKLKAKEDAEAKAREEHEQQQYEQVVQQFKTEIGDFVESNKETYELVHMHSAQDLVFQVIEEHHKSTSRVLDLETAVKAVEEHLEEEAKKIFEAKKFKQASTPQSQTAPQTAPTLSNALSQQAPQRTEKKLSRDESRAFAASMIRMTKD